MSSSVVTPNNMFVYGKNSFKYCDAIIYGQLHNICITHFLVALVVRPVYGFLSESSWRSFKIFMKNILQATEQKTL